MLGALVACAVGQLFAVAGHDNGKALFLYGVGLADFLGILVVRPYLKRRSTTRMIGRAQRPLITRRMAMAALTLLLLISSIFLTRLPTTSAWLAGIGLWLLSLGAAIGAALPGRNRHAASGLSWQWPDLRGFLLSREVLAVAGLTLVGAALRLYRLADFPSGIHGDETGFGLIAEAILRGQGPNPFGTAFLGDAAMFVWFEAMFVAMLGHSITAIRAFAAVSGALTLPVFYLLIREMFGKRVGLLALALLAGSAVHNNFSRIALPSAQVPLFTCLALFLLYRAKRTQRPVWWLSAGITGAFVVYFHFVGRLVPVMFALYFVYLLVAERAEWRAWLQGAGLAFLGGVLAVLPMAAFDVTQITAPLPGKVIFDNWSRVAAAQHTTSAVGIILGQLWTNVLAFFSLGDTGFYAFARSPMLPAVLAPLGALGLVLMMSRLRDARYALLAIWFWAVVIVPGALTIDSPQADRLLSALFPCLAVAALILDLLMDYSHHFLGKFGKSVGLGCGILIPIVAGTMDNANYFGPAAQARPYEATTTQAEYIAGLGSGYRVYVAGTPNIYFDHSVTQFLAPDVQGGDLQNPTTVLPLALPADHDLAFVVYPHMAAYLPLIRSLYPNSQTDVVLGQTGEVFTVIRANKTQLAQWQGLTAHYASGSIIEPLSAGLGGHAASYPATVQWSGSLYIQTPGSHQLSADGGGATAIDGASGASGNTALPIGWHTLEVRANLPTENARIHLTLTSSGQPAAAVPAQMVDARSLGGNLRGQLSFAGSPPVERVDRAIGFRDMMKVLRLEPPLTADWQGTLMLPSTGNYSFALDATGAADITLDRRTLITIPPGGTNLQTQTATLTLTAGPHPITIHYSWERAVGMLEVLWTPPGGKSEIIPPEAFVPTPS